MILKKPLFIIITTSILSAFVSCALGKMGPAGTQTEQSFASPQDFANREIMHLYAQKRASMANLSPEDLATWSALELEDARLRIAELEGTKAARMSYDPIFLEHLQNVHVPAILQEVARRKVTPSKGAVASDDSQNKARLVELADALRNALKSSKDAYLLRSLFELLAFSRSETLGDGRIGTWNPASVETIQDSAVHGLLWVLDQIAQRKATDIVTYEDLMQWHRALLGAAGHSMSSGGMVNDIHFLNKEGQWEHAALYVRRWLDAVNASSGSLEDAAKLYEEFLHLHPFGDSNGRIAEVGKVLITSKSGLLPIVTREKTAAENYLFQKLYGTGRSLKEVIAQAEETLDILAAVRAVTKDQPLTGVDLVGSNILFSTSRSVFVMNRTYYVKPDETGLPPIRGAPVVLDETKARASYVMRVTWDQFKSFSDIKPAHLVRAKRLGRLKLEYPIFAISKTRIPKGAGLTLQFLYTHPEAGDIVFNNHGNNYDVPDPRNLALQAP